MKRALFACATWAFAAGASATSEPRRPAAMTPHLVAISVPDARVSSIWYEQKLGFKPVGTSDHPDYGLKIVILDREGFRLELVENRQSYSIRKYVPDYSVMSGLLQGMSKLAFLVDNADAVSRDLNAKGVKPVVGPSTNKVTNVRQFIIADPDGNLIQFIQRLG